MKDSNGNVLFLILIAVALFAALAYAVSQSNRSGGATANAEQVQIRAGELISYVTSVQNHIMRMQLTDGVDPINLAMTTPVYTLGPIGSTSANCWLDNNNCSGSKCQVFNTSNPNGMTPVVFGPEYVTTGAGIAGRVTPGHLGKRQAAIYNIGTAKADLVIYIPYIRADVCNAINAKMGFTTNFNESQTFPVGGEAGASLGGNFGGCATAAVWDDTLTPLGDQATQIAGQRTFCIPYDTASPGLALIHVVIER